MGSQKEILEQIEALRQKAPIPALSSEVLHCATHYGDLSSLQRIYGKNYFDGTHNSGYGRFGGYKDTPFFTKLAKIIDIVFTPQKVLDVGCAKGFLVREIRKRGIDAYGTDISSYAIATAPDETKPFLKVANVADLPFPDDHFDLVVCLEVMEHLFPQTIIPAIAELHRITKKHLFLSIARPENIHDSTHFSLFPREVWDTLFHDQGFKVHEAFSHVFVTSKTFEFLQTNFFVLEK